MDRLWQLVSMCAYMQTQKADKREFRRRILQDTVGDTSANPVGRKANANDASVVDAKVGMSIASMQGHLFLQLLHNEASARQITALYLALVSEVTA